MKNEAYDPASRYAPRSKFEFLSGSWDEVTGYTFNKKVISHHFCPTCGVGFVGSGMGLVAVNVRTVDGLDLDQLKIKHVDGANF